METVKEIISKLTFHEAGVTITWNNNELGNHLDISYSFLSKLPKRID